MMSRVLRIIYVRNRSLVAPVIPEIDSDIVKALRDIGHRVTELDLTEITEANRKGDQSLVMSLQGKAINEIREALPELAIGFAGTGILPIGPDQPHLFERLGIPYVGLFYDNPLYFANSLQLCKDKSRVCFLCIDSDFIMPLRHLGFKNTRYLPIGTSLHESASLAGEQPPDPPTPVVFVGGVKEPKTLEELQKDRPEGEREFIAFAWKAILEEREPLLEFMIKSFIDNHPVTAYRPKIEDFGFQKLWFVLDAFLTSHLRAKTVEAAAEFGVSVYGPGWEKWIRPLDGQRIRLFNSVGYRTTLPWLYRRAAIVVNRSPLNLQNAIQQRCLDVGACGGFILTEYKPLLERHFAIGDEIAVYENCEDLRGKIRFYLENRDERLSVAQRLHKKVLESLTWKNRAADMISTASDVFGMVL